MPAYILTSTIMYLSTGKMFHLCLGNYIASEVWYRVEKFKIHAFGCNNYYILQSGQELYRYIILDSEENNLPASSSSPSRLTTPWSRVLEKADSLLRNSHLLWNLKALPMDPIQLNPAHIPLL
jgi:hypothetical protein